MPGSRGTLDHGVGVKAKFDSAAFGPGRILSIAASGIHTRSPVTTSKANRE